MEKEDRPLPKLTEIQNIQNGKMPQRILNAKQENESPEEEWLNSAINDRDMEDSKDLEMSIEKPVRSLENIRDKQLMEAMEGLN